MLLSSWTVSPTCLGMLAGNLIKPSLTISQDMTTFSWLKKVEPIWDTVGRPVFPVQHTSFRLEDFTFSPSIDRFSGNQLLSFTRRPVSQLYIDDRDNGQLQVDPNRGPFSQLQTMDERNLAAANSAIVLVC